MHDCFENRTLFFATKHQKELVVAPLLSKEFNLKTISLEGFDTDQFGMFSGEIERTVSPIEAARLKCIKAHEFSGEDLILASEGSFFMEYGFLRRNHEVLLLKDFKYNFEVTAFHLSSETNFAQKEIAKLSELEDFLNQIYFPNHGVIIKYQLDGETIWIKDVFEDYILKSKVELLLKQGIVLQLETDMRAMHNPSRMKVIAETTEKLIQNMKAYCPECSIPGFVEVEWNRGLPCIQCGNPSSGVLESIKRCQHCSFSEIIRFPNGQEFQDPQYCNFCNP